MYNKILAGVDFFDQSTDFLKRAKRIAEDFGAELQLLHVIDYIPGFDAVGGVPTGIFLSPQELEDSAKDNLSSLAEKSGLSADICHVVVGPVATTLVRCAEDTKVDLILVCGHGRHGLQKLLGSTANAVLNRADTDVLVVRLDQ